MKTRAILCTALLLAGLTGAAQASEMMMVQGYLILEDGNRVDFEVPLGETLKLGKEQGYVIRPHLVGGEVEFQVSQLFDGAEFLELERFRLTPGQEQRTTAMLPFSLGFKGLAPGRERTEMGMAGADVGEKHCVGCGTWCGSTWVSCTVCASGWCCNVYCNGQFVCGVCHF